MFKKVLVLLLAALPVRWASAETFTIPVLPDTQVEVDARPEMFWSQLHWLVAHRDELHIPLVLHVGDIINWDTPDHRMWETASRGFALLDAAGLPYALANGNHDGAAVKVGGSAAPGDVHANLRQTQQYNRYFPPARFTLQRGAFEPGKGENAFYTFAAGGLDWMVVVMECWPRQAAIDWAREVIGSHPDHNVIVLTHPFLTSKGLIQANNGGYGDTSPVAMFAQMVAPFANVRFVLSGHVDSSACRVDRGVHGNPVYEILQDYQTTDAGGGYIRLLEIDTDKKTVSARMYSPFYDITKQDASNFQLTDVDFIPPKANRP